MNFRRTTATVGAAALLATPLALLGTSPASAADREFRYAGAKVEFDVEKDDGRFEVDVELDNVKQPRARYKVVLRHNGKVFHKRWHRAGADREIEIDKNRPNTRGKDNFKLRVKKASAKKAAVRTIRRR